MAAVGAGAAPPPPKPPICSRLANEADAAFAESTRGAPPRPPLGPAACIPIGGTGCCCCSAAPVGIRFGVGAASLLPSKFGRRKEGCGSGAEDDGGGEGACCSRSAVSLGHADSLKRRCAISCLTSVVRRAPACCSLCKACRCCRRLLLPAAPAPPLLSWSDRRSALATSSGIEELKRGTMSVRQMEVTRRSIAWSGTESGGCIVGTPNRRRRYDSEGGGLLVWRPLILPPPLASPASAEAAVD